jgi:hypothetical protein
MMSTPATHAGESIAVLPITGAAVALIVVLFITIGHDRKK